MTHYQTRLPSTLRQTTHECVYLARCGDFRSCDKDGGHTISSATAGNPMLHTNFTVLSSAELKLLPIKVSRYGNRDFRKF